MMRLSGTGYWRRKSPSSRSLSRRAPWGRRCETCWTSRTDLPSQRKKVVAVQPRGQLWFALEALCRDFRACSGLGEKEAVEVLVVVLTNMLAEQKAELERLTSTKASLACG